jgi:hypothetical protein
MCIHWFCCILKRSDFVVKRIPMFYLVTLCFSLFTIESTTWSRTVIALNSRQHATILMSWESGVMCLYLIEILQSRLAVAHSCEKRWDLVREPDNASRNRCDATLWRDYLSGQEQPKASSAHASASSKWRWTLSFRTMRKTEKLEHSAPKLQ